MKITLRLALIIPRYHPTLKEPYWDPVYDKARKWSAVITHGGHWMSLLYHTILRDGTVVGSAKCPAIGCEFDCYIKLSGWPDVLPAVSASKLNVGQ